MQFTIATILAVATAVVASPLEQRTNWGSCPSSCQYTCSANALVNLITCNSIANGNTIEVPLTLNLRRELAVEKRWGYEHPTCCTADALLNVVTCNDILDGNKVSVPISVIKGW